ncbi:S8 family serine peptidase [Paraeggerthella hongkongensis]|uniref:Peptidase S8/S53 domain-containing protein n=1 Tax=Paraeggerthella hongkongensis TaxID=230658 RepID=A0A3N0BKX3_9ACTN|nr:S8 family serine peptidase [Paraeggerthella hongkongensis]RNL49089.1 hypothetical protein DMP08_01170 [Paraeggerthella hongkongensis]
MPSRSNPPFASWRFAPTCSRPLARLIAVLCAFLLVVGLVPIAPVAAYGEDGDGPAGAEAPTVEEMLNAGPYVEGEALVVYRDSVSQPRSRWFEPVDPLASAGFSVEESWDFSGVDAVAPKEEDSAAAHGGMARSAFGFGNELESGSSGDNAALDAKMDARVARVTKSNASTAELLEELQAARGVLAVAPNYVRKVAEPIKLQVPQGLADAMASAAAPTIPAEPAPAPAAGSASAASTSAADAAAQAQQPARSGVPTRPTSVVEGTDVLPVYGQGSPVANDPLLAMQWSLNNAIVTDGGTPANSDVDLAGVRAAAAAGKPNIVAVLDTGVDCSNVDLQDAMWENPGDIPGAPGGAGTHGFDFVDGDDQPLPDSNTFDDSHGTHCAGIVAASSDNATGISGVSPNTKIMAFRLAGKSTGGNSSDSTALAAYAYILHAKLAGENVVAASNSWIGLYSPVIEYAMNQAGRAGVLTVFCAGNDSVDAGTDAVGSVSYGLSDSPYIVNVAATSPYGAYATYSNHGKAIVDIAVPGSAILSTVATGAQAYLPAAAKLLDDAGPTPNERSLYYHNMADFAQDAANAEVVLLGVNGSPADQDRLQVSRGIGLDGRDALRFDVENGMAPDEGVSVSWRIDNPFKGMSWERARTARVAVMPGVSLSESYENGTGEVSAFASIYADDPEHTQVLGLGGSYGGIDGAGLSSAGFWDEESFELIVDQDSIAVGVTVLAWPSDQSNRTASVTVTDFGIGFPSNDQAYGYIGGTSMACPLVAGAVGLLASVHPNDSALDIRGRIVGGTKSLHDAASGDFPAYAGNYDTAGRPKRTASNGTLDLSVAAGDAVHPNTWAARAVEDGSGEGAGAGGEGEGADAGGAKTLVLEGYGLQRATALLIDGVAVDDALWQADADGSRVVVREPALLDGAHHMVEVSDGKATHYAKYAFPLVDQRISFERVSSLPDFALPDEAGSNAGVLIAAADRLFCLDAKGQYLYSFDPDGGGEWEACASPRSAGFGLPYFRVETSATYANGKIWCAVQYETASEDPDFPYDLCVGLISYDIAADTWSDAPIGCLYMPSSGLGAYIPRVGVASCNGSVLMSQGRGEGRTVLSYDPVLDEVAMLWSAGQSPADDPFSTLLTGQTSAMAAAGPLVCFAGFVIAEAGPDGQAAEYALTLGTYDGERFSLLEPTENAPRCTADEFDVFQAYTMQAVAATGDSLVLAGESAKGLGEVYAVDARTGQWRGLGAKAPGKGRAAVSSACFCRGSYYVLAASEDEGGWPTTSLYRLPDQVELTPNDHVAAARAAEGGAAQVSYDAIAGPKTRAEDGLTGASSQVEHVVLGDTVTWAATPDKGYSFEGWYAQDGSLVDEEAVHRQPVTADVTLTARFAAVGPGPGPAPGGGSEPTPPMAPQAQPDPKPLASTGDGALAAVAVVALSAAGLICALALAARRRRVGR